MADRISEAGFTMIYLPPPWRDDSAWDACGRHGGGEGYFWHDFDLDSRYGTKQELTSLITAMHKRGMKVIVDLVSNHRDRMRMQKDVWLYPGECWANGGHDTGGSFFDEPSISTSQADRERTHNAGDERTHGRLRR
jgi:alpha-amylase